GRLLDVALKPGNFTVFSALSAEHALETVLREPPDLIALDMHLAPGPGQDGVRLCEQLRELVDVPVIFVSADDDDETKVRALRCGDDYVTRPFSTAELLARAEAVLRRARPCVEVRGPAYNDGLLTIDFARHEVLFGGVPVTLTPTEYRLLTVLARHPGRLFLHDELLERVWDTGYQGDHHLLRLHIANLRKKIEPIPARPTYVQTRRGLGYSFRPARPTTSASPPEVAQGAA
ncbi:MAG TPA: response regulator transcription factor, partial [Chloroflexota bacterium]|nr:response regulator transcription factor [Chloroflexota bacterium]